MPNIPVAATETMLGSDFVHEQDDEEGQSPGGEWLNLANQAFRVSSTWLDTTQRASWMRSIANFQGRHPPNSKYHLDSYKNRSRVFRPLTRRTIRKHEAAAALAFFQNPDLVTIEPGNVDDPQQLAAADVYDALLQYRLESTIPWFQTLLGAYQNAMVQGACAAKWYWSFTADGSDEPRVDLIPLENLRIAPAADWIDPIRSSPYIIQLIPMFAGDVLERMNTKDPQTGEPLWHPLSLSEIVTHGASIDADVETIRRQREHSGQDKYDVGLPSEFQTVWVREVIMRRGGDDYVFWTLGNTKLLSDPVTIDRVYRHGRPFVLGSVIIESFRSIPPGVCELTQELQALANTTSNQRIDNVQLALNKRYFVRRGAAVDTSSLLKSVPGGFVMMENPATDVQVIQTPDVTQSSYSEQDRINLDFDDIVGVMGQGTVASNRKLNETATGMQLVGSGADSMTEYQLRTFVETFIDPSLRMLIKLEREYETDENVLALAGRKAQLWTKYGTNVVNDALLEHDVTVKVSIGSASSTPQARVAQLMGGLQVAMQLPEMAARLKPEAVLDELFSRLGHREPGRFFMDDQEFQAKQQAASQQGAQGGGDPRMAVAQITAQTAHQRMQQETAAIQQNAQLKTAEMQQQKELEYAKMQVQLQTNQQNLQNQRDIKALDAQQSQNEMLLANRIGHGI